MRFESTRDRRTTIFSAIIVGLIAAAFATVAIQQWQSVATPPAIGAGSALGLLLFMLYATTLKAIVVDGDRLIVERQLGQRSYPLASIAQARLLTDSDLAGSIRLFGNGGLFGAQGVFRNNTLGRYRAQTNRFSNRFLLIFHDGRKLVLSADRDAELVDLVNRLVR